MLLRHFVFKYGSHRKSFIVENFLFTEQKDILIFIVNATLIFQTTVLSSFYRAFSRIHSIYLETIQMEVTRM